jgi:hypothetical protein
MSCNYHAFGPFPGGEENGEGLHIGLHTGGYCFLLRAYWGRGLFSWHTWQLFLQHPDVIIKSDTGEEVSFAEFRDLVTRRYDRHGLPLRQRWRSEPLRHLGQLRDADGYELDEKEFC